jgi:CRP/FNR family transcriptional regulator, cyclic AMP receptor protein
MPFWDELSVEDREAVEEAGVRRSLAAGDTVFLEGDPPTAVMVVLAGRLKLTRTALDGRQVLIELRGPGEIIGELGAIDDSPRSATATVAEDLTAIVVSTPRFRRLLADRGPVALAVLAAVAVRLRESATRRLESGTSDTMARLCDRLVQLAGDRPAGPGGAIEIESPLTQQELAEWIGASRDAVVLALRRLRQLGWIETGRRRITVLDLDSVRAASAT